MSNTPEQSAFNLEPGAAERDQAIEQVRANAKADFIAVGRMAVEMCCFTLPQFTTDDVWALIPADNKPHEPRAMAAIMKYAEKKHWINPLAEFRASERKEAHRGPKRLWHSVLYPMRNALQPSYEEVKEAPVLHQPLRSELFQAFTDLRREFIEKGYPLTSEHVVTALQPSYEEEQQEPGAVNYFERSRRELSPEMYRELYIDIPVERPREE